MARRKRRDEAGASYHVMNRGVARRTIFDTRADYRFFLAGLARAVRRAEIEVLAYALMRTHFHLFLRSLGGLSQAMRRIQHQHARRFNRLHRRDGPLLRGRFLSRRVRAGPHTRNVVCYVHENPVVARLCSRPEEYAWSSARLLLPGARTPKWFDDGAIRQHGLVGGRVAVTSEELMRARAELVEARLRAPQDEEEERLDASTPERVLAWMRRKARLADGTCNGLAEVGPRTLAWAIRDEFCAAVDAPTLVPGAGTYPTLDLLTAGLLRDVACCGYGEIATILHADVSRVKRLCRFHWRCVELLASYARLAADVVAHCKALLDSDGAPLPGTSRSQL